MTVEERPTIKDVDFVGNKKLSTSQIKDTLKEDKVEVQAGRAAVAARRRAGAVGRSPTSTSSRASAARPSTTGSTTSRRPRRRSSSSSTRATRSRSSRSSSRATPSSPRQALRNAMKKTKVARLVAVPLGRTRPTARRTTRPTSRASRRSTRPRATRTSSSRTRSSTSSSRTPRPSPKKIKRRVRITIPIVEGDKFFINEITDHARATRAASRPRRPTPMVFPERLLLKKFRELAPGLGAEPRPPRRGPRRRSRRCTRRAATSTGSPTRSTRRSAITASTSTSRSSRATSSTSAASRSRATRTTRDKVIRREFALDEGDVMDMEAVKKSLQKISAARLLQGRARSPSSRCARTRRRSTSSLKGTETSRNEIQFGAGYSAFDGFFGQFSFQTRNFLGRGEVLGASAQIGKISNFFDLSYTVPWFMDQNQSVGASLFRRDVDLPDRSTRQPQGGTRLLRQGARPLRLRSPASTHYEDINANYPGARRADAARASRRPRRSSTDTDGHDVVVHAGLPLRQPQRSVRSRRRVPRSTRRVQVAADVSRRHELVHQADCIGSTIYIPVRFPRHARTRASTWRSAGVQPTRRHTTLPIFERFQLGGEQSLRGFQQGAVAARCSQEQPGLHRRRSAGSSAATSSSS